MKRWVLWMTIWALMVPVAYVHFTPAPAAQHAVVRTVPVAAESDPPVASLLGTVSFMQ